MSTNRPNDILTKLDKERDLSKKNLIAIQKKWERILTNEKLESLKNELDMVKERYEDEIQQRDATIHNLLQNFEYTEDQRRMAVASHLQVLDDMIRVHDNQLSMMERDFCVSLEEMRMKYQTERVKTMEKYETDRLRLKEEVQDHELVEKRMADERERDQQEVIEEIRNKNSEDINSLRFVVDTRMEDLDDQVEVAKKDYLPKTDFQSERLKQQLVKDKEMSHEMGDLQGRIDQLYAANKKLNVVANRKLLQNADRSQQLMQRKTEAKDYQDEDGGLTIDTVQETERLDEASE